MTITSMSSLRASTFAAMLKPTESFGLASYGDVFNQLGLNALSEKLNPMSLINEVFDGYVPSAVPRSLIKEVTKAGPSAYSEVIIPRPRHLAVPMHQLLDQLLASLTAFKDVETRVMRPLLKDLQLFVSEVGYDKRVWNDKHLSFKDTASHLKALQKLFVKDKVSAVDSELVTFDVAYPTSAHFIHASESMRKLEDEVQSIDMSNILGLEDELVTTVKYLAESKSFTSNTKLRTLVADALRKGADELELLAAIIIRVNQVNYSFREMIKTLEDS